MRSTFGGLEIGKRGLFAQQTALDTTGHNIANANTPGFSRQRVDMVASRPFPYPGMMNSRTAAQMGTGVEVEQITRLRDQFLDRQYRNENRYLGYYESRAATYGKIEVVLQEGTDTQEIGLQKALDRLWGAWQDLTASAEAGEVREEVVGYAKGVVDAFGHIAQSLKDYQSDLNQVVLVKTNQVNSIATRLRDINAQIARITPHGYTTNDLQDQRDLLLDELSKLVDVQVSDIQNGMIQVKIAGGQTLVDGLTTVPMEATQNPATGFYDVTLGGAPFTPQFGSFQETLEARGIDDGTGKLTGIIPDMLNQFNTLSSVFAGELNALHMNGTNLEDIQSGNLANGRQLPFFISKSWYDSLPNKDLSAVDFTALNPGNYDPVNNPNGYNPSGADDLMVNPLIVADSDLIAAAGRPATGSADGRTAQAIADLKNKVITTGFPNSTTIDGYYSAIIGKLGIDAQGANNLLEVKQSLVTQVENRRQSVSGVSIDDEMTEMIKYQHAYEAAARSITVMDQVLDKIINGMGIVGR
ncbi:Flagellar hook-associated protein FlgK [[Clostridium] ultunense Esp]|nr:Flagellar hook-associated protein FlgK [[Clostridium] ultunense Esp]